MSGDVSEQLRPWTRDQRVTGFVSDVSVHVPVCACVCDCVREYVGV